MTSFKGDVIDTYIYRIGIGNMEYSATTAGAFPVGHRILAGIDLQQSFNKIYGKGLW